MIRVAAFASSLFLLACSSQTPDTTPPETVTDLTVFRVTETTTTLKWTAPGGDGAEGQAASYDLRYTAQQLPQAWATATKVRGLVPRVAGEPESVRVTGLGHGVAYSFGLETLDAVGNRSGLSNIVHANTGDVEGPETVTDLRVVLTEPRSLTVEFTAPGDDGPDGQAQSYDLRYSSVPIDSSNWASRAKFTTGAPQFAGSTERIRITGLPPGIQVFVAVRATDDGGHTSDVSNNADAVLPPDTVPPSAITDLSVARVGFGSVTLAWTAPGNDGMESQATRYDARYAFSPITEATWSEAVVLGGIGYPKVPGTREEHTLAALPEGTLWFAVRALDEAGNEAPVSNGVSAQPLAYGRTWEVRVDGSGDAPTVQAAIDSSAHGDVVLVHPGRYLEHINYKGKRIHVKSAEGPETTILDGNGEPGSVVTFTSGETRESILEGLTVTGGRGTLIVSLMAGAGILVIDASPSIVGNIIANNRAGDPERGFGGGLLVDTGDRKPLIMPVIAGNRFENNYASTNGGGITLSGSIVSIDNNRFYQNECRYDGGGVYIFMGSPGSVSFTGNEFIENIAGDHGGAIEAGQGRSTPIQIRWNLFLRNEAHGDDLPTDSGTGGALSVRDWPATITQNTFVDNLGTGGAPCTGAHILVTSERPVQIYGNILSGARGCAIVCRIPNGFPAIPTNAHDNLFWQNAPQDIGNPGCFPAWSGGDLRTDPLFCDPANDNYRLQVGSPALEAGIGAYLDAGCSSSGPTRR